MPMIAFIRILMDHHLGTGAVKGMAAGALVLRRPEKAHRADNPIQRTLGWIGVKAPIHDVRMVRSKVSFSSPPRRCPAALTTPIGTRCLAGSAEGRGQRPEHWCQATGQHQNHVLQCPANARKGGET